MIWTELKYFNFCHDIFSFDCRIQNYFILINKKEILKIHNSFMGNFQCDAVIR